MQDDNFDWSGDEDIIIREQQAIAVYANEDGDAVIRQERGFDEESDSVIIVTTANLRSLIAALKALC